MYIIYTPYLQDESHNIHITTVRSIINLHRRIPVNDIHAYDANGNGACHGINLEGGGGGRGGGGGGINGVGV